MRFRTLTGTLGLLALFSVAFGYEEAAIVLYLRRISFPPASGHLLFLESGREAATIVVLFVLAWLCGRQAESRLRAFLVAFGLWDVAYYAWLYALSGYPTFTSNDVLFLLPVPWVAPVWSAASFALVLVALGILGWHRRRIVFLAGGLLLSFLSFIAQGTGIVHAYPIPLFAIAIALAIYAVNLGPQAAQRIADAPRAAG
jgi:hypothetical protein